MTAFHPVCAGVAIACLAASPASADVSKAWAAAKANLPATTELVVGFDVAAAVATPTFAKLFPLVVKEERDLEQGISLVKAACKLDPVASVDGIVVAARPEPDEEGIVFVQLKGVDRAGAEACLGAMLKAAGEKSATVRQEGALTVLRVDGDTIHFLWVGPDVVAMTFEPDKKASLTTWSGQQGALAKAPVMAHLGKVDTKAIAWGAFDLAKPIDDDDLNVKRGSGSATLKAGKITLAMRGTFDNAKSASATVAKMKKDVARELKSKSTPAPARKLLRAMVLSTAGAEASLKLTASEADVIGLFQAMFSN